MKLNLLPSYVSKGAAAKTWLFVMSLLTLLSIAGAVFMMVFSKGALAKAIEDAKALEPEHQKVVNLAKMADGVAANPVAGMVTRNVALSEAMSAHPRKYTAFYRSVTPYIPGFFRINDMSVVPVNENSCRLTLVGTLESYRQYGDLMLGLLRIPGAKNVARSGYVLNDPFLPHVTEQNQFPQYRKLSSSDLPTDVTERLDALIAKASAEPTGFMNVGNFGAEPDQTRGAMPNWNQVTVTVFLEQSPAGAALPGPTPGVAPGAGPGAGPGVGPAGPGAGPTPGVPAPGVAPGAGAGAPAVAQPLVSYDLRSPNPRATLNANGGPSGAAGGSGGGAGAGMPGPGAGAPGGGRTFGKRPVG